MSPRDAFGKKCKMRGRHLNESGGGYGIKPVKRGLACLRPQDRQVGLRLGKQGTGYVFQGREGAGRLSFPGLMPGKGVIDNY